MKNIAWAVGLSTALALALPAGAQDACSKDMGPVVNETQAKIGELLTSCAKAQGVEVEGTPVVMAVDGSSAAIIPGAKVKELTRDSFKDWQTLGVFTAQAPPGAEAPSGTFTLRAQADPGKDVGKFQIVDGSGKVVQEGEMTIQMAPAEGSSFSAKAGVPPPGFQPPGGLKPQAGDAKAQKAFFPCYYPAFYYYPFYIHPYYYYGCYYWAYSWPWGYATFRYCWWPWYYPCWWHGYCWW